MGNLEEIKQALNDAHIPALSLGWCASDASQVKTAAYGIANNSTQKAVDTKTLFQAASLSKPISAAIALDLVQQEKWDLDTPLSDILEYGPTKIRQSPYYRKLTTRHVLGQCSGLPNWFYSESDERFIFEPGSRFIYSGVAFDFLKSAIEAKLNKTFEELAQEFFAKANMRSSTFKQLPASYLADKKIVAKAHKADGTLVERLVPDDAPEVPAGSLLTTANDYMAFLRYCFQDDFLREKLLTGALNLIPQNFPEIQLKEGQVSWGLGMGIYTTEDKAIAFHWGNNTGSHAFCAMDLQTGSAISCFVNSDNGPNVFQHISEAVVGDLNPVFNLLSQYCGFNAGRAPKSTQLLKALFPAITLMIEKPNISKASLVASYGLFASRLKDKTVADPYGPGAIICYQDPTLSC